MAVAGGENVAVPRERKKTAAAAAIEAVASARPCEEEVSQSVLSFRFREKTSREIQKNFTISVKKRIQYTRNFPN